VRIEKSAFVYRFYIITDETVEPWWELEYTLLDTKDCYYGFLDSGSGSECEKLSITEFSLQSYDKTYQNPVITNLQAADPDVLYYNGTYYCYSTSADIGYNVYTSKDLVNWENNGLCMGSAWGFENVGMYWAPGVVHHNGKFYMIASVNEHLGFAVADSPLGPFIPEESYLFEGSIDGHIFIDDDGKAYLYYVSWSEKEGYGIYGCELESDIVTPKLDTVKKLISPEHEWEIVDGSVTEGPFMLKHNGIYYLTYSGTGYTSQNYAVGYAFGISPLGLFAKNENNPVFIKSQYLFGVGHHCFAPSPDGSELFIVYHAHNSESRVHPRVLCIDRVRFESSENEIDRLRILGPTFFKQPYPSGAK
jgi:beta-xylosidase